MAWKYQVTDAIERTDPHRAYWVGAAILVLAAAQIAAAGRWHLLLRRLALALPFSRTLRASFAGLFGGLFLPTAVGGDAVRTWIVARGEGATAAVVAATLLDRVAGFVGLLIVAWVAIGYGAGHVVGSWTTPAVTMASVVAIGGILCIGGLGAVFGTARSGRILAPVQRVSTALGDGARHPLTTALVCTISVGIQVLLAIHAYLLVQFLDLDVAFSVIALVTPLIVVLSLIPLSLGGFGVREASLVVLLEPAGVDAADATLLGLLMGASLAIVASPGAFMVRPARRPPTE